MRVLRVWNYDNRKTVFRSLSFFFFHRKSLGFHKFIAEKYRNSYSQFEILRKDSSLENQLKERTTIFTLFSLMIIMNNDKNILAIAEWYGRRTFLISAIRSHRQVHPKETLNPLSFSQQFLPNLIQPIIIIFSWFYFKFFPSPSLISVSFHYSFTAFETEYAQIHFKLEYCTIHIREVHRANEISTILYSCTELLRNFGCCTN